MCHPKIMAHQQAACFACAVILALILKQQHFLIHRTLKYQWVF
jgi:hypothetical protein